MQSIAITVQYCSFFIPQDTSLPFNKYAFLTTHNSFSIHGEPSHTGVPRITLYNQDDSVTDQLSVPTTTSN